MSTNTPTTTDTTNHAELVSTVVESLELAQRATNMFFSPQVDTATVARRIIKGREHVFTSDMLKQVQGLVWQLLVRLIIMEDAARFFDITSPGTNHVRQWLQEHEDTRRTLNYVDSVIENVANAIAATQATVSRESEEIAYFDLSQTVRLHKYTSSNTANFRITLPDLPRHTNSKR